MALSLLLFPRSRWGRMGPGAMGGEDAGQRFPEPPLPAASMTLCRHRHQAGEVGHDSQEAKDPVHGEDSTSSDPQSREETPPKSSSPAQEATARGQEATLPDPCLFSRALVVGPFPWGLALTWPGQDARGSAKPGETPLLGFMAQGAHTFPRKRSP